MSARPVVDPTNRIASMYDPLYPSTPWRIARAVHRPIHDPPRVLVVEDDEDIRRLVVNALRSDGYAVDEAADGRNLLIEVESRHPAASEEIDLIISDIRMPVCTGLQILEALRNAEWTVPVILMTAYGDEATRKTADDLGAVIFDKPFSLGDLRTAVLNLLT